MTTKSGVVWVVAIDQGTQLKQGPEWQECQACGMKMLRAPPASWAPFAKDLDVVFSGASWQAVPSAYASRINLQHMSEWHLLCLYHHRKLIKLSNFIKSLSVQLSDYNVSASWHSELG